MSGHSIPDELRNSIIEYCIDEYVRNETHREILRDKWFTGMSIEAIAEKHALSATAVKNIVYGKGDDILLKAAAMQRSEGREISFWKTLMKCIRNLP